MTFFERVLPHYRLYIWMRVLFIICLFFSFMGILHSNKQKNDPIEASRKKIVIIGSSLAAGWVTNHDERHDFQNGFAQRLARMLAERGFDVVNVSVPGNTTQDVLDRLEKDLFAHNPDIAMVFLSLGNENLASDTPEKAVSNFKSGMERIIARLKARSIIPVIGSCYASNLYSAQAYRLLKETNLWLNELNLPYINLLGGLEDGYGHFPAELLFDANHPMNRGHEELFYAIPPGLFPSLLAGQPVPVAVSSQGAAAPGQPSARPMFRHVPRDVMHSFALAFAFKAGGDTPIARIDAGSLTLTLVIEQGRLSYGNGAEKLYGKRLVSDGVWHWLALSHRYLPGKTTLYIDGVSLGEVKESRIPRQFIVGPAGCHDAAFRNFLIYRAALSDDEAALISQGKLWRGSLEVYAPLNDSLGKDRPAANLAQSNATVSSYAEAPVVALEAIEKKIKISEEQRLNEKVFPEKSVVELPQENLSRYTGVYEIKPGDRISVDWQNNTFWIVDQGKKQDIYPESPERFFIKHPKMEIEIHFFNLKGNHFNEIKMVINGQVQIQARLVDSPASVKK